MESLKTDISNAKISRLLFSIKERNWKAATHFEELK